MKRAKWSIADKSALSLAFASTILILFKKIFLDSIASPFQIFYSSGVFFEGAIASIIAGSIFFLTVNRMGDIRDREVIEPWVRRKRAFIAGQFDEILREVSKASGIEISPSSTLEEFTKAFSAVREKSNAPLMNFDRKFYTWMPYLKFQIDRMQDGIEKLLDRGVYLDSQETFDLIELEDHYFVPMIKSISSMPMGENQTLDFLALSFFDFSSKIGGLGFRGDIETSP